MTVRFVVGSDGHWGRSDGEVGYEAAHQEVLSSIEQLHEDRPVDFFVYNGDLINTPAYEGMDHDPAHYHEAVRDQFLEALPDGIDWYVTHGNHDRLAAEQWEAIYGQPKKDTFEVGEYGFVLAATGNPADSSDYTGPDPDWLGTAIDELSHTRDVFAFQHIQPFDHLRSAGADMPAVRAQYRRDEVAAVFVGHDHHSNDTVACEGVPYVFCCLVGDTRPHVERGVRIVELP